MNLLNLKTVRHPTWSYTQHMDYFTTFDSNCELCGRWRNHICALNSTKHVTCICFVLNYNSICCTRGFKCLIEQEPELREYIHTPNITNLSKMLFISYNDHFLNTEKEEISKCCHQILYGKL